jgi:hypothetical protein
MGRVALIAALVVLAGGGAAAAETPAPQLTYEPCVRVEPALALVAGLRHVSKRTACRLTVRIQKHIPPNDPGNRINRVCWNPFQHVHRFHGWHLVVRNSGLGTMSRGQSYFAFEYQDGPLSCV